MTRSEWICNSCGEGFETKGKRDSHRERAHRQRTSIGTKNQRVDRSENGKFMCKCGRNYTWARSLQRHQRSCNAEIPLKETESDASNDDEGMIQFYEPLMHERLSIM